MDIITKKGGFDVVTGIADEVNRKHFDNLKDTIAYFNKNIILVDDKIIDRVFIPMEYGDLIAYNRHEGLTLFNDLDEELVGMALNLMDWSGDKRIYVNQLHNETDRYYYHGCPLELDCELEYKINNIAHSIASNY